MKSSQYTKKVILVVDDEEYILETLQLKLNNENYDILTASNGKLALDYIYNKHIDLIISDFFMPKLDGLELLRTLNEKCIRIPIIWLTGYAGKKHQQLAWNSGIYDIIEKPFDFPTLNLYINSALNRSQNPSEATINSSLIKSLTPPQISLTIDIKNYKSLVEHCDNNNISITNYLNYLIEENMKKSA